VTERLITPDISAIFQLNITCIYPPVALPSLFFLLCSTYVMGFFDDGYEGNGFLYLYDRISFIQSKNNSQYLHFFWGGREFSIHDFWSRFQTPFWLLLLESFVGTFPFLFFAFDGTQTANQIADQGSGPGSALTQLLFISLVFDFSLAVNVWVFFRVSGGLFNPAVRGGKSMWLPKLLRIQQRSHWNYVLWE
jgi:hypothetical protein